MTRQTLQRIHLWLSIPLGIIITLICLSGAILVFKSEIRDALGMPRVVAPHGHHSKQADGATADKAFGHGRHHAHGAQAHAGHKAKGATTDAKHHDKHGTTTRRDFFSYVTKFHTSLMLGTAGKYIVAYTTLFFVVILISGLWICWPANARQWRQRFTIERHKGLRRLMFDSHVSLGYWVVLWLLLLAITGLGFGLHLVPKGTAAMRVFHELHIGSWGGIITKCITFVVSLIGASLPITGYWLYFKKRCKKANS